MSTERFHGLENVRLAVDYMGRDPRNPENSEGWGAAITCSKHGIPIVLPLASHQSLENVHHALLAFVLKNTEDIAAKRITILLSEAFMGALAFTAPVASFNGEALGEMIDSTPDNEEEMRIDLDNPAQLKILLENPGTYAYCLQRAFGLTTGGEFYDTDSTDND